MFGWFKKKPQKPASMPLYFKDGAAAFEMCCKYMDCTLEAGRGLPALVVDAVELFGVSESIKVSDEGIQTAVLRVASDDGGFIVFAQTSGAKGPTLKPGDFVSWVPMQYVDEMAQRSDDKRFGWMGLIVGTMKTEHINGTWVGDQRFAP